MKITVAAAALTLAIGTAASAFAAPPTGAATPAAQAAASATTLQVTGTIKDVSQRGFTLTTGKAFRFDPGVKSSSLKAGEKVKVQFTVRNTERWASEVSPS